jgi:hypothetical protein
LDPWRSDPQDPPDVLGSHEVPGWAQDVRAKEVATVELGLHIGRAKTGGSHAK